MRHLRVRKYEIQASRLACLHDRKAVFIPPLGFITLKKLAPPVAPVVVGS